MKPLQITLIMLAFLPAMVSVCVADSTGLKLPFPQGESWQMTRGYNPDDSDDSSHRNNGLWADDRYALDFAYPLGVGASWGRILVAPVSGTAEVHSLVAGYGNTILINEGDGHKTRITHNSLNAVINGQYVVQGQPIALCGNTGFSIPGGQGEHAGSHVHVTRYYNGVGVSLDGMSDFSSFTVGTNYSSNNQIT